MDVASDEEIKRLSVDVDSNSSRLLPSNLIGIIVDVEHADNISCLDVCNGYIYSGYCGKSLKVWRSSDLKCLESIKAHDTGFACCSTRSPTQERVTFCLSFEPIYVVIFCVSLLETPFIYLNLTNLS
ncbi:hypothetical protein FXO38_19922 [Capsicum annuum]|uniref:Uncharacterized protein n=1 Tax=Capsicum annuum TaxID=4072 RepID=A0A2G2ZMR1_CAPAN|nr:hypothetical protein FXO38_19922 [Capsicum annuum]KAF3673323.1 hypothetical protein FXO37_07053 [Capsicum annuum]PHT83263.1 hypothetical protein T459_11706 [Capsicum annuum]